MFYRAQISAGFATGVDFLVMIFCYQLWKIDLGVAVAAGSIAGGISNFCINRYWVFCSANSSFFRQISMYMVVCLLSALLNVFGVLLVIELVSFGYIFVRVIVAAAVALIINYPLHKMVVFVE